MLLTTVIMIIIFCKGEQGKEGALAAQGPRGTKVKNNKLPCAEASQVTTFMDLILLGNTIVKLLLL